MRGSAKNEKGDYETRTSEGTLRYRKVTEDIEGQSFKHRIAEIHADSMKRLSKIEAADDPLNGADGE